MKTILALEEYLNRICSVITFYYCFAFIYKINKCHMPQNYFHWNHHHVFPLIDSWLCICLKTAPNQYLKIAFEHNFYTYKYVANVSYLYAIYTFDKYNYKALTNVKHISQMCVLAYIYISFMFDFFVCVNKKVQLGLWVGLGYVTQRYRTKANSRRRSNIES